MTVRVTRTIHATVEHLNNWLGSYAGFVIAVIVSAAWNVAVVLGLDKHGFLYLYLATELGIVTQFNLAIIGRRSSRTVDTALAQIDSVVDQVLVASETLLKLAEAEMHLQEVIVAQSETLLDLVQAGDSDSPSR